MESALKEVPVAYSEDVKMKPWDEEAEGVGRRTTERAVVIGTGVAAASECEALWKRLSRNLFKS